MLAVFFCRNKPHILLHVYRPNREQGYISATSTLNNGPRDARKNVVTTKENNLQLAALRIGRRI